MCFFSAFGAKSTEFTSSRNNKYKLFILVSYFTVCTFRIFSMSMLSVSGIACVILLTLIRFLMFKLSNQRVDFSNILRYNIANRVYWYCF